MQQCFQHSIHYKSKHESATRAHTGPIGEGRDRGDDSDDEDGGRERGERRERRERRDEDGDARR